MTDTDTQIADLAQYLRDANTREAWAAEQGIPFGHFARVARASLVAAGWRPPAADATTYTRDAGYTGPAPAAALPGTVRGVGIAMQRLEMRVGEQLRELERRIGRVEDRVDEMQTPSEYEPADADPDDVQRMLDDATYAFGEARTSSERQDAIRSLLDGWYAAWPKTAVTDPHEGIAWHLVSLVDAAEARASTPAAAGQHGEQRKQPPRGQFCHVHFSWLCQAGQGNCKLQKVQGEHPADEMVWLGDLPGFYLTAEHREVVLNHRCGWEWRYGTTMPLLANLIEGAVADHRRDGCRTEG
ncbi:hypothetical protein [Micromonospora sp. NPDC047730]|uniref:hypothetical protein n=1 Tax=Micromonospora sp. NPDC047730 TaxID=3364253 RepID=UPI0037188638